MLANSYRVNGKTYVYKQRRDEDDFIEASLVNENDRNDVLVSRYGDNTREAKQELESALFDMDIKPDVENVYVRWNDLDKELQHKIECYARKAKSEIYSEWDTMEGHINRWINRMNHYTSEVYPHRWTAQEFHKY